MTRPNPRINPINTTDPNRTYARATFSGRQRERADAVFKTNRCYVSGKPSSAKEAEEEESQRLMPPRSTPAQLGFMPPVSANRAPGGFKDNASVTGR